MMQSKHTTKVAALLLLLLILVLATSCLPTAQMQTGKQPSGFFMGIWHGWIAPISLVVGLFKPEIRIYDIYNTGWWYDCGFYIAIISGFGGISLARRGPGRKERR